MIPERQTEVDALLAEHFPPPSSASDPGPSSRPSASATDVIKKATRAKNGEKFGRLFSGSWESDYSSQSEADLALCSMLAFWTEKDPSAIDSVFRQSGLYRPKWDERHYAGGATYGAKTVQKAVALCSETCSGRRRTERYGDQGDARPVIQLVGGELPAIVDAGEAALVARMKDDLFQRGGLLVRLSRSELETARRGLRRAQGSLLIRPLEIPSLVELLTASARWERFNPKTEEPYSVDCPEKVAKTLAARGTWLRGKKPPKSLAASPLSSVWALPSIARAEDIDHPTPKPIDCFSIPMRQHTAERDVCYEPFAGSGTQIISAERTGRRCFAMEIAPEFVAVGLQRYQDATGKTPVLVENQ